LAKRKKIDEFIIEETQLKVGSRYIWLWVAIEPKHRQILQVDISFERNMLIDEHFVSSLIGKYGKHLVSTDGGTWYPVKNNNMYLFSILRRITFFNNMFRIIIHITMLYTLLSNKAIILKNKYKKFILCHYFKSILVDKI
jgi:transposase-like protein